MEKINNGVVFSNDNYLINRWNAVKKNREVR